MPDTDIVVAPDGPEPDVAGALKAATCELVSIAATFDAEDTCAASHALASWAYAVTAIDAMILKPTGIPIAERERRERQAAIVTAAGHVTDIIIAGLLTREHFHGVYEPLLDPLDELIAATLSDRNAA